MAKENWPVRDIKSKSYWNNQFLYYHYAICDKDKQGLVALIEQNDPESTDEQPVTMKYIHQHTPMIFIVIFCILYFPIGFFMISKTDYGYRYINVRSTSRKVVILIYTFCILMILYSVFDGNY